MRRLARALKRRVRTAFGLATAQPASQAIDWFDEDDIERVHRLYLETAAAPGSAWDRWRHAHMRLPQWFVRNLEPMSEAYAEQQRRLWQLVSGTDAGYNAEVHEREHDWGDIDPVRTPGYFVRRDAMAIPTASDHTLAMGMILKHCDLKAGDWALEYGAGFGHTALALARLGVNVDTVDISSAFCGWVQAQATHFQVPLTPFHGHFGLNPRPGHRYRTIWFFEAFHHCLDFAQVVHRLRENVAPGGRVILAGEPVFEKEYAAVPYPWGLRLHSEVIAAVRQHHWFELGFSEAFLFELFDGAGFAGRRVDCEPSLFGQLYIFEPRP